ncbi:MAG: aerobic-type carbon monoxide dehydrogenase, middle subunit CoxM/CutM-like protein [Holophagaceae bacterium]|nr:aerobic-type carbon monoxide dehydrogenase, middle subunit CoxM/CutM-like protein [Holophagaceae bacterium]
MSSLHLKDFVYFEPTTTAEVTSLLAEHGAKARIMAGGIDLIPRMRAGSIKAEVVINIQKIPELSLFEYDPAKGFRFGAMVSLHTLDTCQELKKHFPIIQKAINQITSVQSKYMGTAVGNVCLATPASDVSPVLMVHDAELIIEGTQGVRTEKVADFYTAYYKTTLQQGEFVTGVSIPKVAEGTGAAFYNKVRTHADIAKITVAAVVNVQDGVFQDAKIALGAVAPVALRARSAEAVLQGQPISEELIQKAAEVAMNDGSPISDFRSNKEYRLDMIRVLVGRALNKAVNQAKGVQHV